MLEGEVQPHASAGVFGIGAKERNARARLFERKVLVCKRDTHLDIRGDRRHATILRVPQPLDRELAAGGKSNDEFKPVAADGPFARGRIALHVGIVSRSEDDLGLCESGDCESEDAENADDQRSNQAWSMTK